jgi:Abortive infection C-terminus
MQTLRELIERHSDENSEFRYYIPIIEKAEANEEQHPDITIECCASLFQGISKTIVNRLDPPDDPKAFEEQSISKQVKAAMDCVAQKDGGITEIEFAKRVSSLVQIVGELRNQRGDISHGRAVPKELQSDRSLARLVLNVSEPAIRYMLASYFALPSESVFVPPYEDNEAFNESLDDDNDMPDKIIYSRALYDQFPEDYLIKLNEYNDSVETMRAELDELLANEGDSDGNAE